MTYITTAQRIGIKEGEINMLTLLLEHRFHLIPPNYLELIQQANADTLLIWGKRILDANSLEEVFQ